jgi:hypothetical protein
MKFTQFTKTAVITRLLRGDQFELHSLKASINDVNLQLTLRQDSSQPHMF